MGKPADNLTEIVAELKGNTTIKKLLLVDCELPDDACIPLEDLFKTNQCLEEVSLEKNKISSHGAKLIAQGLGANSSVKTVNLLQQAVKSFGDEFGRFCPDVWNKHHFDENHLAAGFSQVLHACEIT